MRGRRSQVRHSSSELAPSPNHGKRRSVNVFTPSIFAAKSFSM